MDALPINQEHLHVSFDDHYDDDINGGGSYDEYNYCPLNHTDYDDDLYHDDNYHDKGGIIDGGGGDYNHMMVMMRRGG